MLNNKLKDNEIIKAYEGLTSNQQLNLFRNFYYNDGFSTENGIVANAINDILPNYYKQQAEIERLQKEVNLVSIQFQDIQERQEESQAEIDKLNEVYQANQQLINALNKSYFLAKAEAYKEFAERLKENSIATFSWSGVVLVEDIDNLLKELVGDDK